MAVPNIFATATSSIPLSQLDTNFATAITLGSTALYLGNTTTSVAGLTLTGSAFNGTVGATTPSTGVFTTLSASSTATLSGLTASTALALDASKNIVSVTNTGSGNNVLATSPTITGATLTTSIFNGTVGATTPSTGAFTTLSATGQITASNNAAAQAVFKGWNSADGATNLAGQIQLGQTASSCAVLQYSDAGNTFVYLDSTYNANGSYIKFRTKTSATPFDAMTIKGDGTVTMSLYGAGAATFSAAGVISSVSDETWKIKDGVPVNPDAMLKKLEPGYWYYNDEKRETFGKDRQLGFYAQNVNAAIGPEAAPEPESYLSQDEDGKEITITKPWGYYDRSVLAVTVMSLQKALATIESLTARITALEAK